MLAPIEHRIAVELGVRPTQVVAAIALLDEGATVPFIARYRKEATDGLDDTQLRNLEERLTYLRDLEERRAAILASIDAARALLARDGERLLGDCLAGVSRLRGRLRGIPGLRVLDGPDVDPLKVTLVLPGTGADGNAVEADSIAAGMPVEMADRNTLVAMVTLADAAADLDHLGDLLVATIERHRGAPRAVATPAAYAVVPEPAMSPRDAYFAPREPVPIEHALGRIGAELIAPYPPGIPVLAPGERITRSVVDALAAAREAGVRIAYAADPTLATLLAVSEPPPTRTA